MISTPQMKQWAELCEWMDKQPRKCSYAPIHSHLLQREWRGFRRAYRLVFYSSGWGWRLHKGWREVLHSLESSREIPGKKLDALIATKVMGWQLFEDGYWVKPTGDPEHPLVMVGFWHKLPAIRTDDDGYSSRPLVSVVGDAVWSPSIDICCAWALYELLESKGLIRMSNGDGDSKDVDFISRTDDYQSVHVTAETYELALCLAALGAKGE